MQNQVVAAIKTASRYPDRVPYSPDQYFPELPFDDVAPDKSNHVYTAVRNLLYRLGLDKRNYGKQSWNPLGEIIHPGNSILIKPNMVKEAHLDKAEDFEYIITHGSVLRAICDYVLIALKGKGIIVFADSPETDADFDLICSRNGLSELVKFYKNNVNNISFHLLDLRKEKWFKNDGVIIKKEPLEGDPRGYVKIPLNEQSEFIDHNFNGDYYGATYDRKETQRHHHKNVHEYLISSTVLDSDVIINVPKLKTHKKAGLTGCLKNLVGINGDKNWLPHHTEGHPNNGGDQFATDRLKSTLEYRLGSRIKSVTARFNKLSHLVKRFKPIGRKVFGSTEEVVRSGNWYGNDTVWRMIVDLNKILYFYDSKGRKRSSKRRMFCLVDAIIAGDKMGPLHPEPNHLGFLMGGRDPAIVDRLCARLVSFDYRRIPSIKQSFHVKNLPFTQKESDEIHVVSNVSEYNGEIRSFIPNPAERFNPHFGWKGHIEID